jgi:hypothetical protein
MAFALTVDAGPSKVLNFPARDLTLFGHVTNAAGPYSVQWSQVSGPSSATFSASWALATTVSFTATGSYVFRLTANDGTAVTQNVSVTVNPASMQTAYYVDPTYSGSTANGGAATPWKSFLESDSDFTAKWNTINSALQSNDVIIYFSARQAGADTQEQIIPPVSSALIINRTPRGGTFNHPGAGDTSTHRLTLDGMSLYNTNDATPSWVSYTGSNRFKVNCVNLCDSMGFGWGDDNQRDYVTLRGFEVTGNSARIRWGGSFTVLEYIYVHDLTTIGATIEFNEFANSGPTCTGLPFGLDHDITIRHNTVSKGIGEGIYVAGNYNLAGDGGCVTGPNSGDNHYDILIEGNLETDTGYNGDQGDGIDLKAGLYNVTVRKNTISLTHAGPVGACGGGDGITTLGQMPNSTHESNYLIEQNTVHDLGCSGSDASNGITVSGLHGVTVRNNLIYNIPGAGIVGWTRQTGATPTDLRVRIDNNTVYAASSGLAFSDFSDAPILRNNLLLANNTSIGGTVPSIDSDYNFMAPSGSQFSEGSHSITQAVTTGVVVNASGGDFHLTAGSVARNRGVALSAAGSPGDTFFSNDITGALRSGSWDIGAYTFSSGAPSAPTNLRIVP